MELLQLRYFYTAAKFESISRAARHYNLPQPALSQTISRLERELGVQLFDRLGNRVALNERGRLFYREVGRMLQTLEDGVAAVREGEEPSGEIRLLVLEHRSAVLRWVAQFSGSHPQVLFSICHDLYGEGGFEWDLCISSQLPWISMGESAPLIREEILLAVPQGHPLWSREQVKLVQLAGERFISLSPRSSLSRITLRHCQDQGFTPRSAIVCDDPYSLRGYLSMGMGIAFVPSVSWRGLLGENIRLLPMEEKIYRDSRLIWDGERRLPTAVRLFRDFVLERAREEEG